jgi:hypothetical protein
MPPPTPNLHELAALRRLVVELEARSAPLSSGVRALIGAATAKLRRDIAAMDAQASRPPGDDG